MELLIYLLVLLAVFAIVWWAIGQMSLPPPVRVVAVVVLAVVALIVLLRLVPGAPSLGLH